MLKLEGLLGRNERTRKGSEDRFSEPLIVVFPTVPTSGGGGPARIDCFASRLSANLPLGPVFSAPLTMSAEQH